MTGTLEQESPRARLPLIFKSINKSLPGNILKALLLNKGLPWRITVPASLYEVFKNEAL